MYLEEIKTYYPKEYRKITSVTHLKHIRDLEVLLGATKDVLLQLINNPEYQVYTIPKKRGGLRTIQAPSDNLKKIQRKLNIYLQQIYLKVCPKEVHGFVPKTDKISKGIVSNAKQHVNKKVVLNIDLVNFFESIPAKRVYYLFTNEHLSLPENVAKVLTLLVSFENKLPTGSPTSPVVSNFVCLSLDESLRRFAKQFDWSYSRYADDLTFSASKPMSVQNIYAVIDEIRKHGFDINSKKFRIQSNFSKQVVTGIKVNNKPNLEKEYLKNIRAALYHWRTLGLSKAANNEPKVYDEFAKLGAVDGEIVNSFFIKRLKSRIEYVGLVRGKDDKLYVKLSKAFFELHKLYLMGENI